MKFKFLGVAIALLIGLLSSGATTTAAHASTNYDTIVRTTYDTTLRCFSASDGTLTGDQYDFSNDWSVFLNPANTSYAGRNIGHGYGSAYANNVYSTFQSRLVDEKGWSVTMKDYGPSGHNFLTLYVQKDTDPAYFREVFPGYPEWDSLVSDDTYTIMVHCRSDAFVVEIFDGQAIYGRSGSDYDYDYVYFMNTDVDYPVGYQGTAAPSSPLPPPTNHYTGTIDCGGKDPGLMTIGQAGNNGTATLTSLSAGQAQWEYDLRADVPYTLNISCGGTIAASYQPVYASQGAYWVCDVYGDEAFYCVLG